MFNQVGLADRRWDHDSTQHLPTLRDLIESRHNIVVMSENSGQPPNIDQARQVNAYDVLMPRVRQCQQDSGKFANIVGVNFYDQGDLLRVVDELNGVTADRSSSPVRDPLRLLDGRSTHERLRTEHERARPGVPACDTAPLVSSGTLSAAALGSGKRGGREGGKALAIEPIEPIVLAGIASAMLFPWRVVTRRKCSDCGQRRAKRSGGCLCRPPEVA